LCSVLITTVTRHVSDVEPKSSRRRGAIAQAAREFGVTREHLSRVLHGHRESRSLTRRYAAWAAKNAQGEASK